MDTFNLYYGDRILVANSQSEKEVYTVLHLERDGSVLVLSSYGTRQRIQPDTIIKKF